MVLGLEPRTLFTVQEEASYLTSSSEGQQAVRARPNQVLYSHLPKKWQEKVFYRNNGPFWWTVNI